MLLQFYSHFWSRDLLSVVLEPRTKQLILDLTPNDTEMDKREKKISGIPHSPVVRTPRFHGQGPRFNLWFGELRSHKLRGAAKKKKKLKKKKKKEKISYDSSCSNCQNDDCIFSGAPFLQLTFFALGPTASMCSCAWQRLCCLLGLEGGLEDGCLPTLVL